MPLLDTRALQALRQAIDPRNLDLLNTTLDQWIEQADTITFKSVNE